MINDTSPSDGLPPTDRTKFGAIDVFLTPVQAASMLGLQPSTLAAWRCLRSDGPPFVKIGAAVRYRQSSLLAWADARTHKSTASIALLGQSNE